jgi:hypothetical protein
MGHKRQSSGTMFIPDSLYFLTYFYAMETTRRATHMSVHILKKVDVMSAPIGPPSVNW